MLKFEALHVLRIVTVELGHLLSAAFKIASSTAWDQVGHRKLLGQRPWATDLQKPILGHLAKTHSKLWGPTNAMQYH